VNKSELQTRFFRLLKYGDQRLFDYMGEYLTVWELQHLSLPDPATRIEAQKLRRKEEMKSSKVIYMNPPSRMSHEEIIEKEILYILNEIKKCIPNTSEGLRLTHSLEFQFDTNLLPLYVESVKEAKEQN
jgi:hypothetical protein